MSTLKVNSSLYDAVVPRARVLIVDDDDAVVSMLCEVVSNAGYRARSVTDPRRALEEAKKWGADLVVSDLEMPGLRGSELLTSLRSELPELPVIMITAFGSVELAARCVADGAADFLPKPFSDSMLLLAIGRTLRECAQRAERKKTRALHDESGAIIARSGAMRAVLSLARRAARADMPVLVTGESGVGKGQIARFIHRESLRRAEAFVPVNCGAIPPSLCEAELFGVERGAYTGAHQDRPGLFVQADRGTLFLDEIGEMAPESQVTLLRALEAGMVRPVGGTRERSVDLRVIAATNQSLEEAMREQRFRPDLYYRLNVVRLVVPSLRERPEDIDELFLHFVEGASVRFGRFVSAIEPDVFSWLRRQSWPGNVRELQNLASRVVALMPGAVITRHDVEMSVDGQHTQPVEFATASEGHAILPLADIELRHIRRAMEYAQGNKSRAARLLGIDRRTLYRKLEAMEESLQVRESS